MKFCANKEDAEEVVQDTFMIAYNRASHLRSETLVAYLRKVAIHACYRKRSQNKQQYAPLYEASNAMDVQDEANTDFLPEEYLSNKEQRAELISIIMSLPKMQWETVYLYYYACFGTEEIARLQDCSTSNVRKTLRTARATIKEHLEGKRKRKAPKGILLASLATVSLAAVFLAEEQVFAAAYLPCAAPYWVGAALLESTGAAAVAATGATTTAIGGYMVAACVTVLVAVSAVTYYILWPDEIIDDYISELPAIVSVAYAPAPPIIEAQSTQPPIHTPAPTTAPITEPAPPITEPYTTAPPTTPPPTPAATLPPVTEAPIIAPAPIDRTHQILADLAAAHTQHAVAHILQYYNFNFMRLIRDSGEELRFYSVDEGSGDILVGIAYDSGDFLRMHFNLFGNNTVPHQVMDLLGFMN